MANEAKIWNYLRSAGLSDAGAAGLMGNLYAESALIPTNLQNSYEKKLGYTDATYTKAVDDGKYTRFASDSAGYGLAQWTYSSRKAALLSYARSKGRSVGDLDLQLDFLLYELRTSYPGVLASLCSATDVRAASDIVMMKFENPADQSEAVKSKRAAFGQRYFEQFASQTADEPETPPCPAQEVLTGVLTLNGVTYDITAVKR